MPPAWRTAVALTVLGLADVPPVAQTVDSPGVQVEIVATGLSLPTSMAFVAPGDILVLQKNDGRVRRILNGVLQPGFVLDVAVDSASERGLLGIAIDPDFAINHRVFLYYTESSTGSDTGGQATPLGNRIYSYTWDGSALVNPALVLDLPAVPGPNHDGGVLTFGPEGALYAVIGDLNRAGKLQNYQTGPDPDDTGVILRLDVSGAGLPDNPFFNPSNPAEPMNRYFAYGVRNSFGLAFDPTTGDLWDTENGPSSYDEVNRVVRGFNSGWDKVMGPEVRDAQGEADLWVAPGSVYRDPEFSWQVPVAPTALVFPASPILGCNLMHEMLVADNNCGQLYRFSLNAARDRLAFFSSALQDRVADNGSATCSGEMSEILLGAGFGVVTDMENGPDGRLYVVSLSNETVYRIGPKAGAFPDADGDGVDDACDCAPGDPGAFAHPVEVKRHRVSGPGPTIGWDSQAATAGPATAYTVVTGDIAALRVNDGFASACTLRQGLGAGEITDAGPDPPAGSGYYYLVRAENTCRAGTFGDGTGVPDPRDPLDASLPPACLCASRAGGALIGFRIVGESLTVWITDDAFIDEAKRHLATGSARIPIFGGLFDGRDCDPQWTWHVDPANVMFADAAIEVCDGLPSHIEANKTYWLQTVRSYCPWSARVFAVDDRR